MGNSDGSSIGEAVSGRGVNEYYEIENENEDDEFYIPPRRASLDLGTSPMDIAQWHHVEQAISPAQSYGSMISEDDLQHDEEEDGCSTRVQLTRTDSFSSSYSYESDDCERKKPKEKNKEEASSELTDTLESMSDLDEPRHPSLTVAFTFKAICNTLRKLSPGDTKTFKTMLWKRFPQSFIAPLQSMDVVDVVDRLLECYSLEVSFRITKTLLGEMGLKKFVDYLQTLCLRNEVRHDVSETLKRKYITVCDDSTSYAAKSSFDDVYADLYISTTCDNGPNIEHEVMTIEKLDSNREEGTRLPTEDILSSERLEQTNLRFMLITGVAGSGKSMAVRKLMLDWIEERSHKHVAFLFALPFRELKQFEGQKISLLDIIQTLYPETKKLKDEDYRSDDCKIMIVFDGLDEYKGNLDFQNTELLCDHTDPTTLNVLIVNLLRGRLLYRGLFIVTSRPPVRRCVPWDAQYDEVELRGFSDDDKEQFFKNRFQDPKQAAKVTEHIKSSETLHIMCHLPLFCSLVADECERVFAERGVQAELPRGITTMYTKLLLTLTRQRCIFRAPHLNPEKETDLLMRLGKLAFSLLERGQFKITKSDWKEAGVSEEEAVTDTGLCTQYITKPFVLFTEKVFSFIHPTMQEYLAALYAFLSFRNHGKNIFEPQGKNKLKGMIKGRKEIELYKSAVDRTLQCADGKLDIFLRFLFGMATKVNQELLRPFCSPSVKWHLDTGDAAALIKKISEHQHHDRPSNLQHCMEELHM